jgi:aminopeptidase N
MLRTVVELKKTRTEVELGDLAGFPCVLPNPGDVAYAQFLPDPGSRDWLLDHHEELDERAVHDPLLTAVAMSSLFECVREAEVDPARFARELLVRIEDETDPETFVWLLGAFATCAARYCTSERGDPLVASCSRLLLKRLREGAPGLELESVRFLARYSREKEALDFLDDALAGKPLPPGLTLGLRDRFLLAAALLAASRGSARLDTLARSEDPDAARHAFVAGAAAADEQTKAEYFARYLQPSDPPEQWIRDSLETFHWPRQAELTLPYLERALAQVDFVKKHRRIFFMPAWLDANENEHSSPEPLAIVDRFLVEQDLEPDVRRKLLQSRDGLARAVRIRARWR